MFRHGRDFSCSIVSRSLVYSAISNLNFAHMLLVSQNIASEMIAVDGSHNGWRHLVLPIANTDELVMDAVLTVSLFHAPQMSSNKGMQNAYYGRVIQGLQTRSQLQNCDQLSQHSILLTILLLLTVIMVNGSTDFPILFRMLQSAIDAIGGDKAFGSGCTAEFLVRQIQK